MDWGTITTEDLIEALKEVDCSLPPRPINEFFSKFIVPRSSNKWNSRLKCTFSEKVTRTVSQFSPHLAAKMRPPMTPVLRGCPSSKRAIYICGQPRWAFVLVSSAATIAHASFRTPNLKAHLNAFREEFRAVWRNYSEL